GSTSSTPHFTPDADPTFTLSATAGGAPAAAATVISVGNTDLAPIVIVPATAAATENAAFTLTVHAADPDGQPLGSLTADFAGLPAGNDAAFTPDPGDSTGTLTWTPAYDDTGARSVTVTAANALAGSASNAITVRNH